MNVLDAAAEETREDQRKAAEREDKKRIARETEAKASQKRHEEKMASQKLAQDRRDEKERATAEARVRIDVERAEKAERDELLRQQLTEISEKSSDFETDFEWAYTNMGNPLAEPSTAPSGSAWALLDYARDAQTSFLKTAITYFEKKQAKRDKDEVFDDDEKQQMSFLNLAKKEFCRMDEAGLKEMWESDQDGVRGFFLKCGLSLEAV